MDTGLSTILFVLVVSATAVQSQIIRGPDNTLRKVGDSITLKCVTSSKNCDQVEWKKMEGAQSSLTVYRDGIILDGFARERYSVSGTFGCNLTITQLQINDSGRFTCSQLIDDKQYTKGSVLVVIGFTESESCRTNFTFNALAKGDGYSYWTSISVPANSVKPSNLTLYFQKAVYETQTMDDSQLGTVNTTLTGIARNENVMERRFVAYLSPNAAADFDETFTALVVCSNQQYIVSYPVENVAVSPSGPYYKGARVSCHAIGNPRPTFKWTNLTSGAVVIDGGILEIAGEVGDQYNCTAINTVKGTVSSLSVTIEVASTSGPMPGSSGLIAIIGIIILIVIALGVGVVIVVAWKRKLCRGCLHFVWLQSIKEMIEKEREKQAGVPFTIPTPFREPAKPLRASDAAPNRPVSECNYAELRPEPNSHQIKSNPVNNSSTVYAAVALA